MEVPLAACSVRWSGFTRRPMCEGGITLTSAPVSTRYCTLVVLSVTGNRRLVGRPETLVTASGQPDRFPTWHMGAGTFLLCHQSVRGTSRLCAHSETAIDVEMRVDDDNVESVTGADMGRYCGQER